MKIKLQFDITPKEFRQVLGLPDVAGIQEDVIKAIKKQMKDNMDSFDPVSLFNNFVSKGVMSAGELQGIVERFTSAVAEKTRREN